MTQATQCPTCNAEHEAGQMCPRCLLRGARLDVNQADRESPIGATRGWQSSAQPAGVMKPHEVNKLFPELEILDVIGHGGMGVVYKARQNNLGREVAVKLLSGKLMDDPAFAERFSREARAMAMLNHPNIISIYDFGQRGAWYYLVMEYVDGLNLRQLIQQTKIEPAEAMQIVPKLCDALQYAHDRGVVHRDIKPENVLVSQEGHVKIADFGLAKVTGLGGDQFTLTQSRQVMGTLNYMAPEQVERPLSVDHRADIYSLGVVIYELLTGELPLGRFSPPSQTIGVDVRLDDVVLRALEKEPARRYQQANEFKTGIQSVGGGAFIQKFGGTNQDQILASKIARFVWLAIAMTLCIGGGVAIVVGAIADIEDYLWTPAFIAAGLGGLLFALIGMFGAVFGRPETPESNVAAKAAAGDPILLPMPNYLIALKCVATILFFLCPVFFIASALDPVPWLHISSKTFRFLGIAAPITGALVSAIVQNVAKSKGFRNED